MKPNLALILSTADVTLLLRLPRGWRVVGRVPVGAPDMDARLATLRDAARDAGAGAATCKLILPDDQIMYTVVASPGRDTMQREAAIRDALDQLTPYPLDDLAHAWEADGDVLHVAVVARETLQEAEAFALAHGFHPLSFVASPQGGSFTGEPFFGETQFAAFSPELAGKVQRDLLPTLANHRLAPLVGPAQAGGAVTLPPPEPAAGDGADPAVADGPETGNAMPEEAPVDAPATAASDADIAPWSAGSEGPDGMTGNGLPGPTADATLPPRTARPETPLADAAPPTGDAVETPRTAIDPSADGPHAAPAEVTLPPLAARARLAAERAARVQAREAEVANRAPGDPPDSAPTLPPRDGGGIAPLSDTAVPEGPAPDDTAPPGATVGAAQAPGPAPLDLPGVTRGPADEPARPIAGPSGDGRLPPPPALPPPALAAFLAKRGATLPPGAMRPTVPPSGTPAVPPVAALPFATRRPQADSRRAESGTESLSAQIPTRIASLLQKPTLPRGPRPLDGATADVRVTAADLPREGGRTARGSVLRLPRFGRSAQVDSAAPPDGPPPSRLGSLVGALRRPADAAAPAAPGTGQAAAEPATAPIPFRSRAAADTATVPPAPQPPARPKAEPAATNAFGARRKPPARSGMTGLVLTALLVAGLGAVGLWSALQGTPDGGVADAPVTAPGPAAGQIAAAPPQPADLPPPVIAAPPAASEPGPAPAASPAETATAAPADATVAADPPPQPQVAAPTEPPARPLVAADIWTDAPDAPDAAGPDLSPGPDVPAASGRPGDVARPSLASPADGADDTLAAPTAPPPAGLVFRFDERGLVIPTPEGAVTPEGTVVFLGRPEVIPPGRNPPPAEAEPAAPQAAAPAAETPAAAADIPPPPPADAQPTDPEELVVVETRPPVVPPGRPAPPPATATAEPPPVALPGIPALRPPPRPASLFPEPVQPAAAPDPEPTAEDAALPAPPSDGDADFALLTLPEQPQSLLASPSAQDDGSGSTAALDRALLADPALQGFRPRPRGPVPETVAAATPPDAAGALPPPDPALAGVEPRPRPASVANAASRAVADAQAEAAALTSALAAASDLAVGRSPVPPPRPAALAALAAAAEASAAARATSAAVIPAVPEAASEPDPEAEADGEIEVAAVAPAPSAAPSLPSRANVAAAATAQNAIRLSEVNLIGIFGSASDRRALVRLPSGRMVRVQVGERLDGGQVAAISDNELRYVKNGRNVVLRIGG